MINETSVIADRFAQKGDKVSHAYWRGHCAALEKLLAAAGGK